MIWFDLDNSPHVPIFKPIFAELIKRNHDYFVTSRAHAQTEDLLFLWDIPHVTVGTHGGKNKVSKIINLIKRSSELLQVAKGKNINLAMSHGSRTHLMAAKSLNIPYIWMQDYEYQEKTLANIFASYILLPSYLPDKRVQASGYNLRKVIRYEGFKEEIYLKDFIPVHNFRSSIGVDDSKILITLRPPSTTANYHDNRSEVLFKYCLKHFASQENTYCLIINRTQAELRLISETLIGKENVRILEKTVDGLQLLWSSDIVLGGGGTMNREAALLGVPTYSIFTGGRPYLDEYLEQNGKLLFIQHTKQVDAIPVVKREIAKVYNPRNTCLASRVTDLILDVSKR